MNEAPRCPFTGALIELRETSVPKAGGLLDVPRWFGVMHSPNGGYTTSLFSEKSKLLAFLNGRDGVQPDVPRITVLEEKVAPDTAIEDEGKELHEASQELASKVLVDSGARRHFRK